MQVQHPRQSRDCAGEWCSCHFRDSHLCTCAFLKRLSFSQPATWIVGIFFAPDVFCVKFYWMWLGTLGVVGPCFILGFSIFFLSKGRMGSFEATAHSCLRRPYFTCFRLSKLQLYFWNLPVRATFLPFFIAWRRRTDTVSHIIVRPMQPHGDELLTGPLSESARLPRLPIKSHHSKADSRIWSYTALSSTPSLDDKIMGCLHRFKINVVLLGDIQLVYRTYTL